MNESQVAIAVNVSQPTVNRWLKGTEPGANDVVALANFFGISTDEMLGCGALELRETPIPYAAPAPPRKEVAELRRRVDIVQAQLEAIQTIIGKL